MEGTGEVTLGHYAVAFATYVVLGLVLQSLVLNWIVGPLFPLLVLHLLPRVLHVDRSGP